MWAIEGSRGDYVAMTDFPTTGDWKAVFITQAPNAPQEAIGVDFTVLDKATTVGIGQAAPSTTNPTAADVGGDLAMISSDAHPDPAFYQTTVADALAAHKPFVLVFATPAFCTSAQCGPTLDRVKADAAAAPKDVAFINVEPYKLAYANGKLQPVLDANGQLQTVDASNQWGLVSEPWIFTVGRGRDREGLVRGGRRRRRAQGGDRGHRRRLTRLRRAPQPASLHAGRALQRLATSFRTLGEQISGFAPDSSSFCTLGDPSSGSSAAVNAGRAAGRAGEQRSRRRGRAISSAARPRGGTRPGPAVLAEPDADRRRRGQVLGRGDPAGTARRSRACRS